MTALPGESVFVHVDIIQIMEWEQDKGYHAQREYVIGSRAAVCAGAGTSAVTMARVSDPPPPPPSQTHAGRQHQNNQTIVGKIRLRNQSPKRAL